MNKGIKLILESLSWIIENTNSKDELQSREKEELLDRINDVINPEIEESIKEKTKDVLNVENKLGTMKE